MMICMMRLKKCTDYNKETRADELSALVLHVSFVVYERSLPSVEIVTTCHGINLPLSCNALFTAFSIPPQQGTSILTILTLLILLLFVAVTTNAQQVRSNNYKNLKWSLEEINTNYDNVDTASLKSDNIIANAKNIDADFIYSDHNPVKLTFKLK